MPTPVVAYPPVPAAPGEFAAGVGVLDGHVAGLIRWAVDVEVVRSSAFDDWGDYGVSRSISGREHGLSLRA